MGISNVTVLRWVRDFKGRILAALGRTSPTDVQVRQMPLEAAQKLLQQTPQNPHHRWVIVEMPTDEIEGDGVTVIQPADKPTIVPGQK